MERKGTAATRAKDKYNAANYDQVKFLVPKGGRAIIDEAANAADLSRNAFIAQAINEKIERDKKEQEG
ncbi:transcriptional regulator [Paenibacillus sp. MBLB4367]|uniref:transcriptional regulator n=1 Tax=Paenibacillus sp. MBLB4367 TaxID=3384767 RepID=UPI00390808D3